MPGIVGLLSSAAVPLGTTNIADTLEAIRPYIDEYGTITRTSFEQRVTDKRRTP